MSMVPAGYTMKKVAARPDWLDAAGVRDVYSVSNCISEVFCDYVGFWRHNGHWLFDSLDVIEALAAENSLSLGGMTPFFYRIYPLQWSGGAWEPFAPESSFTTEVRLPERSTREGFDVVTYSAQTSPECSPLSCNGLAAAVGVNAHCLIENFDRAKLAVESGAFATGEPGPFRILEVHTLPPRGDRTAAR